MGVVQTTKAVLGSRSKQEERKQERGGKRGERARNQRSGWGKKVCYEFLLSKAEVEVEVEVARGRTETRGGLGTVG